MVGICHAVDYDSFRNVCVCAGTGMILFYFIFHSFIWEQAKFYHHVRNDDYFQF